ncbi:TorD/DmsD family molecular chaperone [Thermochromatium tepidum]|nr:molecular chaperone TorD family protein [Thermochromatium tepidum]
MPIPGEARDNPPMMAKPDPSHLRRLALLLAMPETGALEALRELAELEPWLLEPIAELDALPLEHWQAEHTRLFVSGYPKTPCPPFESAHRQGTLGGTVLQELQGLYRRAGLDSGEVPPDYLGAQLEFAAYLLDVGSAEGLADTLAAELWEAHLCRWLPRLARDLQSQARLALYRALGACLGRLCPKSEAQASEDSDDA